MNSPKFFFRNSPQNNRSSQWTFMNFSELLFTEQLWATDFEINSLYSYYCKQLLAPLTGHTYLNKSSYSGIYPSTLTNVRFLEKDWVLKWKKQLQIDRNCSLGSGADLWWGFKGQNPKTFRFLMSNQWSNGLSHTELLS